MKVRNEFTGEPDKHVGDIFDSPFDMTTSRCGYGNRLLAQDIIHYGEIVRCKVPNNINILLKEAQVYSNGIKVKYFSQFSVVDQLFHLSDRACVDKCVVHHKCEVFSRCL